MTAMAHFVYQRIHVMEGRPLHLAAHLNFAALAFRHIYGIGATLDEKTIEKEIAAKLHTDHLPSKGSETVLFCLSPGDDHECIFSIVPERVLLDTGHTLSSLRPRAVSFPYSIPFVGFPTSFHLSAAALFDSLALLHHGATRSVRRDGDLLISCSGSPLFGIRGKTLFTASPAEGAAESVERRLVIAAAARSRLDFLEEAVPHSELKTFDELFYADASGITALSECDGARFMSLAAPRLIKAVREAEHRQR